MSDFQRPIGQVRIFGCGGAGIKITNRFETEVSPEPGYAEHHCCYIDTSHSDLMATVSREKCFLFSDIDGCEDVDGAGQVRADIVGVVRPHIGQILQKFTPCELNIIVVGTSGGSGSVIAPLLANELISRGEMVIVLAVTSTQSQRAIYNTISTLQTFEQLSKKAQAPTILSLVSNGGRVHSEDADAELIYRIASLLSLYSRQHQRLDLADLRSWANFHKVTSVPAQLVTMHVCNTTAEVSEIPYPITIASLVTEGKPADLGDTTAEYLCEGWHKSEHEELHFVLTNATLAPLVREYTQKLDNLKQASAARPSVSGLGGQAADDDILVL